MNAKHQCETSFSLIIQKCPKWCMEKCMNVKIFFLIHVTKVHDNFYLDSKFIKHEVEKWKVCNAMIFMHANDLFCSFLKEAFYVMNDLWRGKYIKFASLRIIHLFNEESMHFYFCIPLQRWYNACIGKKWCYACGCNAYMLWKMMLCNVCDVCNAWVKISSKGCF